MMKKNNAMIVAIVSCVLVAICLFQNYKLKQDIAYLKTQLSSIQASVQTSSNNIYSEVQEMLQKEASLLSASGWEYGEADMDAGMVEVFCHVSPKEYSAGQTLAAIICNEQEYPMELINGEYVGKVVVPIYVNSIVERVVFKEGDSVRTEELSWGISPRYDYVTMVNGQLEYSKRNGECVDDTYMFDLAGVVHLVVERKGIPVEVKSIALVAQIDGQEVNRMEIPLSSAVHAPEGSSGHQYQYEVEEQYEIPVGSEFCLYLETVDGDNLYHRNILELFDATKEENEETTDPVQVWNAAESNIYDAEGNPLFEFDWSRYK